VVHVPRFVQGVGVDRHLDVEPIRLGETAVNGRGCRAPVFMELESDCPGGNDVLPLPRKPKFIGSTSVACSMSSMCRAPGVHVVAFVPVAGPVPPPIKVVTPLASASYTCCGLMK